MNEQGASLDKNIYHSEHHNLDDTTGSSFTNRNN